MVSIWFVVAMECLLLFACALSDPAFIRSMARDRTFPLWERVESTFSLIEALSFGFLFAVAAFCLEYYRFQEARIFFLLGCELFAVRMIAVTYKNLRGTWKWMFVPIICGVMIAVTIYLLGIVDGAQAEKREQTDKMDRSKWDYVHNLYQARTTKVEAPHQRDISIESLKLMDSSALAHQGLITAEQMRVMVADWADVTPNTATDTPQHIKQRQQALADRFHRSFRPLMVLARDESAEIANRMPPQFFSRRNDKHFSAFFHNALNGYDYDASEAEKAELYLHDLSTELAGYARQVSELTGSPFSETH